MIRTFALATARSFINRLVHQIRRMRQPRYLFSALAGIAYFGWVFSHQMTRRSGNPAMSVDVVSLVVLVLVIGAWMIPSMSALEFTEPEMHFLFTAPLTRSRVLLYKLIRSQPGIIVGIFVGLLFGLPKSGFVGLWVVYTTVMVYMMFVALARERLRERGIPPSVVGTIALVIAGALTWFIVQHAVVSGSVRARMFADPALQPILFAPRFVAETLFVRSIASLAGHIAVMALGATVIFFLATRLRVNFNELVITASQRAARWKGFQTSRATHVSIRRVRPLFALREHSSPEMAIAWKNTIALVRISGAGILVVLAIYAFLVAMGVFNEIWMSVSLPICAVLSCAFPLAGAMMIRQDLRMDVTRLDVLKTCPVEGPRLVAAEIAAPAVAMSIVQLWFLSGLAILLAHGGGHRIPYWPQALVIAFLFTIPVCLIQLVLLNAVPLFFPGWAIRPQEDQRGVGVMGQQILTVLANVAALALALAPAAALAAAGFFVAHRFANDNQLILAATAVPGIALLAAEAWMAIRLLGGQYDRMDLAKDLEPGMI